MIIHYKPQVAGRIKVLTQSFAKAGPCLWLLLYKPHEAYSSPSCLGPGVLGLRPVVRTKAFSLLETAEESQDVPF